MIKLGRKQAEVEAQAPSKESYPGLSLYDIEQLPFDESDVGKKFTITAEILVRSVSSRKDKEGKTSDVMLDFLAMDVGKRKKKEDLVKSLKGED